MLKSTKPNLNSTINTIDENISHGVKNGVLHLSTNGVHATNNDQSIVNFSSYSYLNLEHHPSLKKGCIDATKRYGTQFGYSRAFLSLDIYDQLEEALHKIFKNPLIVAPSTTLAHQAVMPVLINRGDLVIADQHAHASMHFTLKNIRDSGVDVELIRHNRVDLIAEKIQTFRQKYNHIWYICDGVYSMYGDYSPVRELELLMNQYPQFHVYFDDAHGMSWCGENGKGYVLSQIEMHPQMILVTSLNKAFATAGGVIVVPNEEWKRKIRTCGGTLIFSTPVQPPMLGAGLASAQLHLSPEFKHVQETLANNITFCRKELIKLNLPDISDNNSPIFYLPTSLPKISYNLTKRMMEEGFYLTPTLFPAVSMRRAGLRYCMNVENTEQDIAQMLEALSYHYPKAIQEEGAGISLIEKAFKITTGITETKSSSSSSFKIFKYRTINEINKDEWNQYLGENGAFDWDALDCLEKTFQNNALKENNWNFYYLLIRDHENTIQLATFFTKCWCKDDLFKSAAISQKIEELRQDDPYLLCSETLMMGSLLTEGQHLYMANENQPILVKLLLDEINELQKSTGVNAICLRDFDEVDGEIANQFINNGFVKIQLPHFPNTASIGNESIEKYIQGLPRKKRQEVNKFAVKNEHKFEIRIADRLSSEELKACYELYMNVKKRSFGINTFDAPFKFFSEINNRDNWEIIIISLKNHNGMLDSQSSPLSIILCNKTKNNYTPQLIGLNYDYLHTHNIYRQSIYQIIKRAIQLKSKKIYFGLTASTEKRRFGAQQTATCYYVQIDDTFNSDILQLASENSTIRI